MPSLDVAINALRAEVGSKKFDRAVKKIQRGAAGVDKSLKKNTTSFKSFGSQMQNVVVGMFGMAAAYKGLRFAQSAVREFALFESQLANVSTMLDAQTMQFLPQYKTQLTGLAVEFGQTTETLSKGLYDILSASVGAADAVDVLRVASKAAIGGLTSTAIAADAITTVMNAYGFEAKDATKISDILFATVKGGKITFGELGSSIGKVVSIAATAGLELEQVAAGIATMTRAGINADMAMTALKAIITGFISPTDEAIMVADEFKLTLNAATLETLGLTGAMELLKEASAEQLNAIFPNVRALLGVAAATKNLTAMTKDLSNITDSTGASQEAFTKNADTLTMALNKNKQELKELQVVIGEGLAPALESFLIGFTKTQNEWITGWKLMTSTTEDSVNEIKKLLEEPGILTKWKFQRAGGIDEADALANAAKEFARIQKEVQEEIKANAFVGPPSPTEPISKPKTDEEKKLAAEKAEAYRRMYDDMDARGEQSFQNRRLLLKQEYERYEEFVDNKILLDQWYDEQKAELDQQRKLSGDDFQAGFKTSIEVMQQDMMTWGEIGAQSAEQMKTSFAGAVKSMVMQGATLKEAMHGFAMSMLSSFIDVITQMIAMKVMASAFGVGAPAGGGDFIGPMRPSAKGNVFRAGVKAFRNGGLIGQPTVFPMANGGVGLAGEAGTEAIMPLGRDNQGRLGVRNSDEESKTPIKIVNVVDESMMEEYLNTGAGERAILNIMSRNREGGSESFV